MFAETNPVFEQFLRDHPEYACGQRVVEMPDGSTELCVRPDALRAFLRWCLFNGHGDPRKIVAFLAEMIPQLKAMDRGPTDRKSVNGTEPADG